MRQTRPWLAALAFLAAGVLVAVACRTPEAPVASEVKATDEAVTMPDVPGASSVAATPVAAGGNKHAVNAAIILN